MDIKLTIYGKGHTAQTPDIRCVVERWEFHDTYMQEQFVSFSYQSPVPVQFAVGDWCEFRGERYTLNYIPTCEQRAGIGSTGDSFVYDGVKLNADSDELTRCEMLDVVYTSPLHDDTLGTNYTGSADFTIGCYGQEVDGKYYAPVHRLLDYILSNLVRLYGTEDGMDFDGDNGKWKIYIDDSKCHTDDFTITLSHWTVSQAVAEIHNTFKLDYVVRGRKIIVGDVSALTSENPELIGVIGDLSDVDNDGNSFYFGYGRGNNSNDETAPDHDGHGLFMLKKVSNSEQGIVTRLRAVGSTRNMPFNYYFRNYDLPQTMFVQNLQLPDTFLPYTGEQQPVHRDGDPVNKTAGNAHRDTLYDDIRHVKGETNDAYIDKNDDAETCPEGIREGSARWDGTDGELPEIYPTITDGTYRQLRANGVPDQLGVVGQRDIPISGFDNRAFPYYDDDDKIDDVMGQGEAVELGDGRMYGVDKADMTEIKTPIDLSGCNEHGVIPGIDAEETGGLYSAFISSELFKTPTAVMPGTLTLAFTEAPEFNVYVPHNNIYIRCFIVVYATERSTGVKRQIASFDYDPRASSSDSPNNAFRIPNYGDTSHVPYGTWSEGALKITEPSYMSAELYVQVSSWSRITANDWLVRKWTFFNGSNAIIGYDTSIANNADTPFSLVIKDNGIDWYNLTETGEDIVLSFKSGYCAGMDFNVRTSETKRVVIDPTGTSYTTDGGNGGTPEGPNYWNGTVYPPTGYRYGWLLSLERYKDESIYAYYPSQSAPIDIGDKYVVTGIELPDAYIRAAEQRLLEAATEYLADNCETNYTYQPSLDDIYLQRDLDKREGDGEIEKSIFWRLYAGLKFPFRGIPVSDDPNDVLPIANITIEQVVIKMGEKVTPQVDITLNDDIQQSALQKVQTSVDRIYGSIFGGAGAGAASVNGNSMLLQLIKTEGSKRFLVKQWPDTPQEVQGDVAFDKSVNVGTTMAIGGDVGVGGKLNVGGQATINNDAVVMGDLVVPDNNAVVGSNVEAGYDVVAGHDVSAGHNVSASNQASVGTVRTSSLPGTTSGVLMRSDGTILAKNLELSESLEVPEIRFNRATTLFGATYFTQGGGIIESVTKTDLTHGTCTLRLEDGEAGAIAADDLCVGMWHNVSGAGNSLSDYDNHQGKIGYKGFCTIYFKINSVSGTNTNTFTYELRNGYTYHPQPGMHFSAYANPTIAARQSISIQTKDYLVSLRNMTSWEYGAGNIYYVRGLLPGFDYIMGNYAEGEYFQPNETGLILGNIYFYGSIRNFEANMRSLMVEQSKGGWLLPDEEDTVIVSLVDGNGNPVSGDEVNEWRLYKGSTDISDHFTEHGSYITIIIDATTDDIDAATTFTVECEKTDNTVIRTLFVERPSPTRGENAVQYKLVAAPDVLGLNKDGKIYWGSEASQQGDTATISFKAYQIDGSTMKEVVHSGDTSSLWESLKYRIKGTANNMSLSTYFTWNDDDYQITFELVKQTGSNWNVVAETTVKMVVDGTDGTDATFSLHQLACTADSVKIDKNGAFSRAGFVCNVSHTTQDGTSTIYRTSNAWPSDLAIRYTINTRNTTMESETAYVDADGLHEDGTIVVTDGGGNQGVFFSSAIRNVAQTSGGTNLYLYLWQEISGTWTLVNELTIPFIEDGADGEAGESPVAIDLTNETDTMLYQADGTTLIGTAPTSTWNLYQGGDNISGSVSRSASTCVLTASNCTAEWTATTGTNAFRAFRVTNPTAATASVDVSITYQGTVYTTTFTVKKIVGGKKYELICSPNAITINRTTHVHSSLSIAVTVYMTDSNTGLRSRLSTLSGAYMYVYPEGKITNANKNNYRATLTSGVYTLNVEENTTESAYGVLLLDTEYNSSTYNSHTLDAETIPVSKTADGAAGASVTVTSNVVEYAASNQGTDSSAVTGWDTSTPTVPQGSFLWTRVTTTFSDGSTPLRSYSVSYNATDGTSVTITSQSIRYAKERNGVQPTSFPYRSISEMTLSEGDYLWVRTIVTYSNGVSTTTYSVSRLGTDGDNGYTTHFAYATSSDGTQDFSLTNFLGATYIGTYNDDVIADSTDPSDYVWTQWKGDDGATVLENLMSGGYHERSILVGQTPSNTESGQTVYMGESHLEFDYTPDKPYTVSVSMRWNGLVQESGSTLRVRIQMFNESNQVGLIFYKLLAAGSGSGRLNYTFDFRNDSTAQARFSTAGKYKCRVELVGASAGVLFYSSVKAEQSTQETAWIQASDDANRGVNPNILNYTKDWKDKDGVAMWNLVMTGSGTPRPTLVLEEDDMQLNNTLTGNVATVQTAVRCLSPVTVPSGQSAVFSCDLYVEGTQPRNFMPMLIYGNQNYSWYIQPTGTGDDSVRWDAGLHLPVASSTASPPWKRFFFFVPRASEDRTYEVRFKHNGVASTASVSRVHIRRVKVEVGMYPTAWVISETDKVGRAGLPGADAVPAVFCGEWSSSALYYYDDVRRDIVLYNGSYYAVKMKGTSVSSLPTNTNDWEAFQGEFKNVATDIMIAADVLSQRGWFDHLEANNIVVTKSDFEDVIIRGVLSKMVTTIPMSEFYTAGGAIQPIEIRKYSGLANSTFGLLSTPAIQYLNVWRCGDVVDVQTAIAGGNNTVYLMLPAAWYSDDYNENYCYMCPGRGGTMYDFGFYAPTGGIQHGFRMEAGSDVLTRSFEDAERPFTFDDMRRLSGRTMVFRNTGTGILFVCAPRYRYVGGDIVEFPPEIMTSLRLSPGETRAAKCVYDTDMHDRAAGFDREGYHWEFEGVSVKMLDTNT